MPITFRYTNKEGTPKPVYKGSTYFSKTQCPHELTKDIIKALKLESITHITWINEENHSLVARAPSGYQPGRYITTADETRKSNRGEIIIDVYKTQGIEYPLAIHVQLQRDVNLYLSHVTMKTALRSFEKAGLNLVSYEQATKKEETENTNTLKITSKL